MQLDTISVLARSHELVAYARHGPIRRAAIEEAYWGAASDTDFLLVIGFFSALMVLLLTILVRGSFGKNLQAAAGNEVAA